MTHAGPLLTLCAIVRDGGTAFAQSLHSVRDLVDEMVIVDTGSTDDSVAVARGFGARVLERAWSDDFAAARNHGLEDAKGRWILVLDADEVLAPHDRDGLRRLLDGTEQLGFFVPIVSDMGEGDPLEGASLRLFRRSPRVRFRRRIHEQVVDDLRAWSSESGRSLSRLPELRIEHSGYRPEERLRRRKSERNHRLFRLALAEEPDDAYLWAKFADSLRESAEPGGEALTASSRALELVRRFPPERRRAASFVGELLAVHLCELFRAGRAAEALELTREESPELVPSTAYAHVAAVVAESQGALDDAERWVRKALEEPRPGSCGIRPGIQGAKAWSLLARVLLRRGRPGAAEVYAARAIAADERAVDAWRTRVGAALAQGDLSQAAAALGRARRHFPDDPGLQGLHTHLGRLEAGRAVGVEHALLED